MKSFLSSLCKAALAVSFFIYYLAVPSNANAAAEWSNASPYYYIRVESVTSTGTKKVTWVASNVLVSAGPLPTNPPPDPVNYYHIRQKSDGGAIRHLVTNIKIGSTTPPPLPSACDPVTAQFRCDETWGVVFNLTKLPSDACYRVKIERADLSDSAVYSGLKVIDGKITCQK
jgi:hypothetical protein